MVEHCNSLVQRHMEVDIELQGFCRSLPFVASCNKLEGRDLVDKLVLVDLVVPLLLGVQAFQAFLVVHKCLEALVVQGHQEFQVVHMFLVVLLDQLSVEAVVGVVEVVARRMRSFVHRNTKVCKQEHKLMNRRNHKGLHFSSSFLKT